MSRASQWADDGQNRKAGTLDIMNSDGLSIDVYRRASQSGRAGFTGEAAEPDFLRAINGRVEPAIARSNDDASDDYNDKIKYLGITDDPDVQTGDRWEWAGIDDRSINAKVIKVMPIEAGSQVWLEEVRR